MATPPILPNGLKVDTLPNGGVQVHVDPLFSIIVQTEENLANQRNREHQELFNTTDRVDRAFKEIVEVDPTVLGTLPPSPPMYSSPNSLFTDTLEEMPLQKKQKRVAELLQPPQIMQDYLLAFEIPEEIFADSQPSPKAPEISGIPTIRNKGKEEEENLVPASNFRQKAKNFWKNTKTPPPIASILVPSFISPHPSIESALPFEYGLGFATSIANINTPKRSQNSGPFPASSEDTFSDEDVLSDEEDTRTEPSFLLSNEKGLKLLSSEETRVLLANSEKLPKLDAASRAGFILDLFNKAETMDRAKFYKQCQTDENYLSRFSSVEGIYQDTTTNNRFTVFNGKPKGLKFSSVTRHALYTANINHFSAKCPRVKDKLKNLDLPHQGTTEYGLKLATEAFKNALQLVFLYFAGKFLKKPEYALSFEPSEINDQSKYEEMVKKISQSFFKTFEEGIREYTKVKAFFENYLKNQKGK